MMTPADASGCWPLHSGGSERASEKITRESSSAYDILARWRILQGDGQAGAEIGTGNCTGLGPEQRPDWQRDALRRIVAAGRPDDAAITEITALCKKSHGAKGGEQAVPLAPGHLPGKPRLRRGDQAESHCRNRRGEPARRRPGAEFRARRPDRDLRPERRGQIGLCPKS